MLTADIGHLWGPDLLEPFTLGVYNSVVVELFTMIRK